MSRQTAWAVWFIGDAESEPCVCSHNNQLLIFDAEHEAEVALADQLGECWNPVLHRSVLEVRKVEITLRIVDDDEEG